MKIMLNTRSALVHAFAAGREIWCLETCEGFSRASRRRSIRNARQLIETILSEPARKTFFYLRD